jgi:hypothetical protein
MTATTTHATDLLNRLKVAEEAVGCALDALNVTGAEHIAGFDEFAFYTALAQAQRTLEDARATVVEPLSPADRTAVLA